MRFTGLVPAHAVVFLVAGWGSGVELREFGFGIGPRLWTYLRFELRLIRIAGHAGFRTSRSEEVDTTAEEADLDDAASRRYLDLSPVHRPALAAA